MCSNTNIFFQKDSFSGHTSISNASSVSTPINVPFINNKNAFTIFLFLLSTYEVLIIIIMYAANISIYANGMSTIILFLPLPM